MCVMNETECRPKGNMQAKSVSVDILCNPKQADTLLNPLQLMDLEGCKVIYKHYVWWCSPSVFQMIMHDCLLVKSRLLDKDHK